MATPTQFGALPMPVPLLGQGETLASDPGLDMLLSFAQAVLQARCGTVYEALVPRHQSHGVVTAVHGHNPSEMVISEKDFPGLWAWRTGGVFECLADDFDTEVSTLELLWIFPVAKQETQKQRSPLVNGLAKALGSALLRGRDPSWHVPMDTDPRATDHGSFLHEHAGWFALEGKPLWKLQDVIVEKGDASKATYAAVQWTLTVRERVQLGALPYPLLSTTLVGQPNETPLVSLRLPGVDP